MGKDEHVTIHCPHCTQKLAVSVHFHATTATCPACHKAFPFAGCSAAGQCRARAAKLGYRFVDLHEAKIPETVLKLVPETTVRTDRLLPVAEDGNLLTVAMSDPQAQEAVERLRFKLNRPILVVMTSEESLGAAIDRCYPLHAGESPAAESASIDFVEMTHEVSGAPAGPFHPGNPLVVQRVQRMIVDAYRMGASRFLILPLKDRATVAYRIRDAVCVRGNLEADLLYPVLVRLMTMVNLQGAVKVTLGGTERKLGVRFKTTPHGLSALVDTPQGPSATALCRAQANRLGYRFVDLDEMPIEPDAVKAVPEAVAREYQVMPVAIDSGTLLLAFHNPSLPETLERLRFILNHPISVVMAPEGSILVAIDHHYGHGDPEVADVLLWELAQAEPPVPDEPSSAKLAAAGGVAGAVRTHLRTAYREEMFQLFDRLRSVSPLCRQGKGTDDLEVVFSWSNVMTALPEEARQYVDDKIWALREAILARIEDFLEHDRLAHGLATTYAQYLGCCRLAAGLPSSIDPASAREACVNFLYALAMHSFPAIESNGAMVNFVTHRLGELSSHIAAMMDDPSLVVHPRDAVAWVNRVGRQMTTEEFIERGDDRVAHWVELLIAESLHQHASRLLLLPQEDHIEVAFRVQDKVYPRNGLPLSLLYPLLDRLSDRAEGSGEFTMTVAGRQRQLRVAFLAAQHGPAALVEIAADTAAHIACRDLAAKQGYSVVDLGAITIPPALLALVPGTVAWRKTALPVAIQAGTLTVAVSEPPNSRRMNELRLTFNAPIHIVLAPEDEIRAAVYRHYRSADNLPASSPEAVAILQASP